MQVDLSIGALKTIIKALQAPEPSKTIRPTAPDYNYALRERLESVLAYAIAEEGKKIVEGKEDA